MTNRQYGSRGSKGSNTSSSTNSSPAPTSNGSGGMKFPSGASPSALLAVSGGWLLARMFLFGGALLPIEAIAILVADGFAYTQGGKGQKKLALLIMAVAAINLFFPGFNQGIKNIRETQLNPPGEMTPIVLKKSGKYTMPNRAVKLCLTMTGDPKKNEYINQQIQIDAWTHPPQISTGCVDVPDQYKDKQVTISLGSYGKQYTSGIKEKWNFGPDINNDYDYYIKKIGVGTYPTLHPR